ncbi:MAG: Ldh family oxidoreductase [Pirellulaceae bacterium]
MTTIVASKLTEFAVALLDAGGATDEEARRVGSSLVNANLCGYESHGVMRIPYYVQAVADGDVVSGADLTISVDSPTHIVANANWGFGQVQAGRLLKRLTEKAHDQAVAAGTLTHCGHIGRLGEYCEAAAAENLISIVMVNTHGGAIRVAPPGGTAPRLGTNPLAIGVPLADTPLILDCSTSVTAEGKVRVKRIAGEPCPPGWLLDNRGRPTTDPNTLYGDPPGTILPMGGTQTYRGFGLALMIEILAGALSGGVCAREPLYPRKGNCVFALLLDPARFGGTEAFSAEITRLAEFIRGCPRAEGVEQILLPGDPERFSYRDRSTHGVFLDGENWAHLVDLARRLSVPVPDGDAP